MVPLALSANSAAPCLFSFYRRAAAEVPRPRGRLRAHVRGDNSRATAQHPGTRAPSDPAPAPRAAGTAPMNSRLAGACTIPKPSTIAVHLHYAHLPSQNISHMEDPSLSSTWVLPNVPPFSLTYRRKLPELNNTRKEFWRKLKRLPFALCSHSYL